ncbi:MAG: EamA family transporter [Candidatus Micrarchaeota archaeon]|nr:EamA family transporter [Candidatus Micrarchaeota archaeon]
MDWRIAAVVTMLALGVYNILVKKFVDNEDWRVVIPFVFVASLVLFIYFLATYQTFADKINTDSVLLSVALALIFAISIFFTYLSFKEGGPVNIVVPIFSLSTFVSVILAVVFLKETVNFQTMIGIILSLAGMVFLLYK